MIRHLGGALVSLAVLLGAYWFVAYALAGGVVLR